MHLNLKLSQKGLILVAVPLVFQLIFVSVLNATVDQAEAEARRASEAKAKLDYFNKLTDQLMATAKFLYAYRITHQARLLQEYDTRRVAVPDTFRAIRQFFRRDKESLRALEDLENVVDRVLTLLDEVKRTLMAGDDQAFEAYIAELKPLMQKLHDASSKMVERFRQVEEAAPKTQEHYRQLLKVWIWISVGVSVVLATSLAVLFNRTTADRLNVIMDNTKRFARGQTLAGVLSGRDELAHLDRVFRDMTQVILEAAQRRRDFVNMITHDIRTPISSIRAGATLITQGVYGDQMTEKGQNTLRMIDRSTEHVLNLINDLLDIEKLEAGMMDMHFEQTPIAFVFEKALQPVRGIADQKRITIEMPETEEEVFVDGERLVQVLINLLSNALKFSPEGSTIVVSLKDEGERSVIGVADSGPGIPEEFRASIFERFKQVESATFRKKGGTGLGLAICKNIIELHGGKIGVESEEGKGSKFWFSVPKTESALQAALAALQG